MWAGKRPGRANIETPSAPAAPVHPRRIGPQFQGGINFAQKQPGAKRAGYQIGVLALPAQPGQRRQRLFQHRGRVDKHLDLVPKLPVQPPGQPLQPLLDHIVIIAPTGINRYRRPLRLRLDSRLRSRPRPIIHPQRNDRARLSPQPARIAAPLALFGQPAHIAMMAGGKKPRKPLPHPVPQRRRGKANGIEPQREGLGADNLPHPRPR